MRRAKLTLRLLLLEGARSILERRRERRSESARQAAYPLVDLSRAATLAPVPVLNVLPFPLRAGLGGVALALAARLEVERAQRAVALLVRDEDGIRLEVDTPGGGRAAVRLDAPAWRELAGPADAAAELGLAEAVRTVAAALGARSVHFESLVGATAAARHVGREHRLALSAHDFALFCRRPNLIEARTGRFCGFCRDLDRCARCLAVDDDEASATRQADHRQTSAALAAVAAAIVHPSTWSRQAHLELFPALAPDRQRVIPPALASAPFAARAVARPPRHVAFVGQAAAHKGLPDFLAAVASLRDRFPAVRWSILGGGSPEALAPAAAARVERLGYYRAPTLAARLVAHAIDLAVLPSRFPETHSLALDDCMRAGVPVVAADLGALGERSRALGAGWCFDPERAPAALGERLAEILGGVAAAPAPVPLALSTPALAARAHLALYDDLAAAP